MARRVERLLEDLQELAKLRSPEEKIRGDRQDFEEVASLLQENSENKQVIYLLLQAFFEGLKKQTARAAEGGASSEYADEAIDGNAAPPRRRRPSGGSSSGGRGGGSGRPRRRS